MIAAALAYLWIYLGVEAIRRAGTCTDRIDLSLFQLGRRLLEYLLNQGEALLVAFNVPPPDPSQSVR